MSINVTFQTVDVELIQGVVFDYVRGKGSLESLRPKLRRYWDTFNIYYPFKQMVNDAIPKTIRGYQMDSMVRFSNDGIFLSWRPSRSVWQSFSTRIRMHPTTKPFCVWFVSN